MPAPRGAGEVRAELHSSPGPPRPQPASPGSGGVGAGGSPFRSWRGSRASGRGPRLLTGPRCAGQRSDRPTQDLAGGACTILACSSREPPRPRGPLVRAATHSLPQRGPGPHAENPSTCWMRNSAARRLGRTWIQEDEYINVNVHSHEISVGRILRRPRLCARSRVWSMPPFPSFSILRSRATGAVLTLSFTCRQYGRIPTSA